VYDALTADRVYREAWPAERALALLDEETGVAFDPECVAALRSVVVPSDPSSARRRRRWPVNPTPRPRGAYRDESLAKRQLEPSG
jgi:HD-GYP domain-containing protein (c-di-GMP phosphodiesterase class II)